MLQSIATPIIYVFLVAIIAVLYWGYQGQRKTIRQYQAQIGDMRGLARRYVAEHYDTKRAHLFMLFGAKHFDDLSPGAQQELRQLESTMDAQRVKDVTNIIEESQRV